MTASDNDRSVSLRIEQRAITLLQRLDLKAGTRDHNAILDEIRAAVEAELEKVKPALEWLAEMLCGANTRGWCDPPGPDNEPCPPCLARFLIGSLPCKHEKWIPCFPWEEDEQQGEECVLCREIREAPKSKTLGPDPDEFPNGDMYQNTHPEDL